MDGLASVCLEVVSYGSGKKRGYEKPGLGGQLLEAVNALGHEAKGMVVRSARGASSRIRSASAGTHRTRTASAGTHRKRYASGGKHRKHGSRRASHRRQYAAAYE